MLHAMQANPLANGPGIVTPDHGRNHVTKIRRVLKHENVWMILANGHRMSAQAERWDDMVPFGRALYDAAPDRCIFGTDWPHTHSQKEGGGPKEDALIDLVCRFLPDEKARRAVLVDNPARLHGFD